MEIDLVEKVSNLTFGSFYNKSLECVVVHFFNKDDDKNDIVAYLAQDLTWDVREILDETSELDALKSDGFLGEIITISHKQLGIYKKDSNFDVFIRKAIFAMSENEYNLVDDKVLEVLNNSQINKTLN
jgi:hypothetical protein